MRYCYECNVNRGNRSSLGDLIIEDYPPAVYWKRDFIELRINYIKILSLLLERSVVPASDIVSLLGSRSTVNSLRAIMTRLRRHLPSEIKIKSVYGQGYQISVGNIYVEEDL
ncbi:winged helix-turn-helix domain-containing protein [Sphingomonas solaris]|uniref:Winged helix-turn-helix domain-containing protein n=1 Tax=Alterirhizorhabdus solaris TaxID=2529389 RepID=A0A558QRA0_9SPHN|nr:winged helix-turn-helix domain-containing protein [Sphingomonas solaris]